MLLFTGNDLARGAGIFDHIMATEVESPKRVTRMRSRDAIGIIAAGFASGLATEQVGNFIDTFFEPDDHELLCAILHMYDGEDNRIHLWNRNVSGNKRLCNDLRFESKPQWDMSRVNSDNLLI